MAVAQPSNEYGLWARVQEKAPWPTTNEDMVGSLAADLRTGSGHFSAAGGRTLDAAGWSDDAGKAFVTRMQGNLDAAGQTGGDLGRLADSTDRFATVVTAVKTDVRDTVEQNIPLYGTTFQLPAGVAESAQNLFVDSLADWSNARVRNGASQVSGAAPAGSPAGDALRDAANAVYGTKFDAIEALTGADPVGITVQENLTTLAAGARNLDHNTATNLDGQTPPVPVYISAQKYPESAQHILDAQNGTIWRGNTNQTNQPGKQRLVTINRPGATTNRRNSLRGVPTAKGFDRDEYPPAVFKEGGAGASVKYVTPSDNRGAGASMGNQLRPAEVAVNNQIDGGAGTVDDLADNRQASIEVR